MVLATMELMSFVNTPYPLKHAKQLSKKSLYEKNFFIIIIIIIIIIRFFINVQIQGKYTHQWAPIPDSWLAAHMANLTPDLHAGVFLFYDYKIRNGSMLTVCQGSASVPMSIT